MVYSQTAFIDLANVHVQAAVDSIKDLTSSLKHEVFNCKDNVSASSTNISGLRIAVPISGRS